MLDTLINDPQARRKLLKFLLIVSIVAMACWAIAWIYGHSIISVNVANPNKQTLTYKIVNQSTQHTDTVESTSANLKRIVPKGDYEVLVKRSEHSYFTVIKTKSFLARVKINAQLQPEKFRAFVGNEPGACSYYDQVLLISSPCDGGYSELAAHTPATKDAPTVTTNEGSELAGFSFGGIIWLQNKRLAFVQGFRNPESPIVDHKLVEINNSLQPISTTLLAGLDESKEHRIERYRSGFVVYSKDFSEIKYYSSAAAKPETIRISAPAKDGLSPISLSVYNEKIALLYSKNLQPEEESEHGPSDEEVLPASQKVAQLFEQGKTRSIVLGNGADGISSIKLCGDQYLCYKNAAELSVINIGNNRQTTDFKIVGVRSVQTDGSSIFIERENEVLGVNLTSRAGSIQYSYGTYESCGIQPASPTGYVICLLNPKENLVALYIDPQEVNKDSIDKKILSLLDQPFIDSVSAYKSYLYAVPELGEPVYDPATQDYAPDPSIREKTSRDINGLINEIGINRSKYNIINTNP